MNSSDGDSGSDYGEEAGVQSVSDWTQEELAVLDQALFLYPAEQCSSFVERCILVAAQCPTKSARDVALRISNTSSDRSRLQPGGDHKQRRTVVVPSRTGSQALHNQKAPGGLRASSRANSTRREGAPQPPSTDTSTQPPASISSQPLSLPPPLSAPLLPSLSASCLYPPPSPPTNSNSSDDACIDIISAVAAAQQQEQQRPSSSSEDHGSLEGAAMHGNLSAIQALMEQNYSILNTFKSNMEQCRMVENTDLLVRLRDNVLSCLGHMDCMGGPATSLPPLPVQLNLDLANKFLPPKMMMPPGMLPPFSFNPSVGPSLMMPSAAPPQGMIPVQSGLPPGFMPPHMMMMQPQIPREIPAGMVPSTSPPPLILPPGMLPQQPVPLMRPPSPAGDPIAKLDQ